MIKCEQWEVCTKYDSGDNRPPNHNVRLNFPCIHFNGEWCEDPVVGAKKGDSCDITKRHELLRNVRENNG